MFKNNFSIHHYIPNDIKNKYYRYFVMIELFSTKQSIFSIIFIKFKYKLYLGSLKKNTLLKYCIYIIEAYT